VIVIERVVLLSKKFGGIDEFCKLCGINAGSVRNARQRKSEVKEGTLDSIAQAIPNINLRWLLLGEGEMFLGGNRQDGDLSGKEFQENNTQYIIRLNDLLEKRVNELERELKKINPDAAKDLGIE
jgi:hypothetical protein